MSEQFGLEIEADSSAVSVPVLLRSSSDGSEVSGAVAADLQGVYWRQGSLPVDFALVDLAAADDDWAAGGVIAADNDQLPGMYRLDLPDAAVAAGADWVVVALTKSGAYAFYRQYNLRTKLPADAGVLGPGADQITIRLTDPRTGLPVADSDVWITADAEGGVVVAGTRRTNSNGVCQFLLDAGATYYLWSQKDGQNENRGVRFVAVVD